MIKVKDINFKNPSKEDLFELCMSGIKGWGINEDAEFEINEKKFLKLLFNNDLEPYFYLLIEYQIIWNEIKKVFEKRRIDFDNNEKNIIPYKLKIARILQMLLSGETKNFDGMEFTMSGLYQINISEINMFPSLKEVFIKEFERLGLNLTEYTKEEALEEIFNYEDYDDEWYFNNGFDFGELEQETKDVADFWIEKYRSEHYMPREITLDIVKRVIKELELLKDETSGKVGAKVKNILLGGLAKELSLLHRIEEFLNQDKYSSIVDYPLSNKTCRFIFDYFEIWGLLKKYDIRGKSVKDKNEENRANYIKALIKRFNKSIEKDYLNRLRDEAIYDKNRELQIDLFKKVKDGLLTPEERHRILSS